MSSDNERTRIGKISTTMSGREDATVVRKPAQDPNNLATVTKIPEVAPKVVSVPLAPAEPKKSAPRMQTETVIGQNHHSPQQAELKIPSQKKSPLMIAIACLAGLFVVWFALSRMKGNSEEYTATAAAPHPHVATEAPIQPHDVGPQTGNPAASEKQIHRMTASEFGSHFRRTIEENR